MFEFKECASCAVKPGSPYLCESCLHNRTAINLMKAQLEREGQTQDGVGTANLRGFVADVVAALRQRGLEKLSAPGTYEIGLVIDRWAEELEIDKDWPADLHPADILDDYIFPVIEQRLEIAESSSGIATLDYSDTGHACGDVGCAVPRPAPHKKPPS